VAKREKATVKEEEILAAVETHPLIALLEPAVRRQVVRASSLVNYRAKRTFLKEGDPPEQAYFLIEGSVRVFHRARDGTEVLLKLFRAPVMFGEMEVMANRPFLENVVTLSPSTVLHIPRGVFMQLLPRQHAFTTGIALDLAARLCIAADNLKALAFSDVDTRLANVLVDYAELASSPVEGGLRIDTLITQDGIARDLAVSRKAVGEALLKMKREGLVSKREGRYVLHSIDSLKARRSKTLALAYRLGGS
jgi:CRP-like cAMP-binding protein